MLESNAFKTLIFACAFALSVNHQNSLAASAPALTARFYVSSVGNDNWDGSASHPFASLSRAVVAMEQSAVKTTDIVGGSYSIKTTINLGPKDSGITIESASGTKAVLDGRRSLSTLIQLTGATNVTLKGLTFQNTVNAGASVILIGANQNNILGNLFSSNTEGILLKTGSSNNTITGNELDNSATSAIELQNQSNNNMLDSNFINVTGGIGTKGGGIFLHGANNNTISHNLVENTAGMGIGVENWDSNTVNIGNTITGNVLNNTNMSALSTDSGAIYQLGRSNAQVNSVISGNYISGPTQPLTPNAHIVAIYLDELTSGVQVTNNIVADTVTHALQIHGGSNITVRNNIFDLGANSGLQWGKDSAVLFHTMSGVAMNNDIITQNIIASTSPSPLSYCSIGGSSPTITNNFYMDLVNSHWHMNGDHLSETSPHWGTAYFADQAAGNYAIGSNSQAAKIAFVSIDQQAMGLHPTGIHWY